jgi:hypothetical protein
VLELGCARPEYWDLTRPERDALIDHWKKIKQREGWKFPAPDTPENRKASQHVLASILKAISVPAPPKK